MTDLVRISRLSDWLFWAATVLTYALPLTILVAILRGWFDPASLPGNFPVLPEGTPVTPFQGTLVAGVAVLAVFPLIAAFIAMASLFNRYRRGEILTDGCADDILRIGRAMIFVALATVLVPTLQILILSWNAPQRMLSIGLDGGTLGFLLSAGLMFVIGWVMREAAVVKAENEGFV
jgi:hypothetical protein